MINAVNDRTSFGALRFEPYSTTTFPEATKKLIEEAAKNPLIARQIKALGKYKVDIDVVALLGNDGKPNGQIYFPRPFPFDCTSYFKTNEIEMTTRDVRGKINTVKDAERLLSRSIARAIDTFGKKFYEAGSQLSRATKALRLACDGKTEKGKRALHKALGEPPIIKQ